MVDELGERPTLTEVARVATKARRIVWIAGASGGRRNAPTSGS